MLKNIVKRKANDKLAFFMFLNGRYGIFIAVVRSALLLNNFINKFNNFWNVIIKPFRYHR